MWKGLRGRGMAPNLFKGSFARGAMLPFCPSFPSLGSNLSCPGQLEGKVLNVGVSLDGSEKSPLVCIASPPTLVVRICGPRLQVHIRCCLLACGIGRRPLYWRQWGRNPLFFAQTAMFPFSRGVELFNNFHAFQHRGTFLV